MTNTQGLLLVLSGPSGSGKGTLLKQFMAQNISVHLSVSAATRNPRAGEIDGKDYHFISKESFESLIQSGQMLEYARYCDNYYGTPTQEVLSRCEKGIDVVLEIEVQGAMQVKVRYPDAVLIFVLPPSLSELQRRLHQRATESSEMITKRLDAAKQEIACASRYDYVIVNDDLDQAVMDLEAILRVKKNCSGQTLKNKAAISLDGI